MRPFPKGTSFRAAVPRDQMELDPTQSTAEAEPTHPSRRAYWVMRLVGTTILYGGYLTPKLFAPKEVWTQVKHAMFIYLYAYFWCSIVLFAACGVFAFGFLFFVARGAERSPPVSGVLLLLLLLLLVRFLLRGGGACFCCCCCCDFRVILLSVLYLYSSMYRLFQYVFPCATFLGMGEMFSRLL